MVPVPTDFLPPDSAICSFSEIVLKPTHTYSDYLWSNGQKGKAITITQPGLYWLQATNGNRCSGKDSIMVVRKDCMKGVFVPTAFSPNLDGKNDLFKPFVFGSVTTFEWSVHNRYGQIVFSSNNPSRGWDGKVKGVLQNSGAFTWTCRYQFAGEAVQVKAGSVVLVR